MGTFAEQISSSKNHKKVHITETGQESTILSHNKMSKLIKGTRDSDTT